MVLLLALVAVLLRAGPASATQAATWNFTQADVTAAAQAAGNNGSGVVVAVVDTWVEASHADFGGRVLAGADCSSGTCTAGLAAADGCEPHGTHVAGTIASASYGVAPGATILPLRVLSGSTASSCAASVQGVSAAIDYAVSHSAKIINLSLGDDSTVSASSTALTAAVGRASNAGVLVVFAAGNSDRSSAATYGGTALIVAATGPSGALASYSDHGSGISLAAPGGDVGDGKTCTVSGCVVSTWSNGQFAALEGTSMAAPHVAGAAALLFAQNPSRTRAQVISILEGTARPLANAGSGLLDVNAAVAPTPAQVASASPTAAAPTHPVLTPTTHAPVVVASKTPTPTATATKAPATSEAPPTSAAASPSDSASPLPSEVPPSPSASPSPSGSAVPVLAEPARSGSDGLPAVPVVLALLAAVAAAGSWGFVWTTASRSRSARG